MSVFSRFKRGSEATAHSDAGTRQSSVPDSLQHDAEKRVYTSEDNEPIRLFRLRIFAMVTIVSMGGLIFGYDTGQISGFLAEPVFLHEFAANHVSFTNVRSGTIVALLSIGTLIGALIAAPVADRFGRKMSIIVWNIVFCIGVIVQITTTGKWYQIAIGRWVSGLGVGGLSVLTPMYQSETAPRQIRGSLVSCYQLFITLGIFIANAINYGTEKDTTRRAWQLPMGIGFIWSFLMIVGICFLDESPRYDYRNQREDRAVQTMAKSYGVSVNHREVRREIREIKAKYDEENIGDTKHRFMEFFTSPRMKYRILLGITLQALQQLTGANFFFYYGTSIFTSVGLSDSFVTAMILSGINFGTTFFALYVVERFGRRKTLMAGSAGMFVTFMVFASVGSFSLDRNTPQNTPGAGAAMIVFASLFIFCYASTWAAGVWVLISEIFPSRHRAKGMAISTASNWLWNFLIAFFTPFITDSIHFRYGYVFAACNALGFFVAYFFVLESQGRTLEETDTMYISKVKPWHSSKWVAPEISSPQQSSNAFTDPGMQKEQGVEGDRQIEAIEGGAAGHRVA